MYRPRLSLFSFVEIDREIGASLGQLYVLNHVQLHRRPELQLPEWIFEQSPLQLCHATVTSEHRGSGLSTFRDP